MGNDMDVRKGREVLHLARVTGRPEGTFSATRGGDEVHRPVAEAPADGIGGQLRRFRLPPQGHLYAGRGG